MYLSLILIKFTVGVFAERFVKRHVRNLLENIVDIGDRKENIKSNIRNCGTISLFEIKN